MAVYLYFLSSTIGSQYILNDSIYSTVIAKDYYVPFYTIIEFVVYMGWLKVSYP